MKLLTVALVPLLLVSASPEDKTDLAIRRAVSYLVTQQDKDGAIQARYSWANRTAITAMSIAWFQKHSLPLPGAPTRRPRATA